jgi:hypothetical protein
LFGLCQLLIVTVWWIPLVIYIDRPKFYVINIIFIENCSTSIKKLVL